MPDTKLNVFEFDDGKMVATRAPLPEMKLSSLKTLTKEKRSTISIEAMDSTEWAPWGKDRKWPTTFRQKIHQVPLAGEAIRKLVALMYGNGLVYFKNEDLKEGAKVKAHHDDEIEEFLCSLLLSHLINMTYLDSYVSLVFLRTPNKP